MDKKYAKYLLAKTKDDYNLIADDFSRTRSFVWEELKPLADYIIPGEKILDLGCGNGRLLQIFKGKNIDYFGVDSSEKLIEIAKKRYPNKKFQVADALNLPFPNNYFDKIYSIAVLHHIPSVEFRRRFLKEAKRVLKPEGLLILTVWNWWDFWRGWFLGNYFKFITKYTLLKIFGKSKLDFKDVFIPWGDKIQRYFHCFTLKELSSLVREINFQIKDLGYLNRNKTKKANIYLIAEKP
jgi:SAM-dependent methyltransferase